MKKKEEGLALGLVCKAKREQNNIKYNMKGLPLVRTLQSFKKSRKQSEETLGEVDTHLSLRQLSGHRGGNFHDEERFGNEADRCLLGNKLSTYL